jgi:FtsP/CotA-like multicopper oxidase with cupredoxin domain
MEPIDRRTALILGGAGLLSMSTGAVGLWQSRSPALIEPLTGLNWQEPEVLRSEAGTLTVRLEAAAGSHRVAGRQVTTLGYNGGLPGPTLQVRPGDTLRIELVNRLAEPTNLHVHGLHVSPQGNGDNVFVSVAAGKSFTYEHQLPRDHPPGVFWYHPHHHGNVADQVFGGLYGAIIVEDDEDLPVSRERVMVVSDITLDESGKVRAPSRMAQMSGREGDLVLVNGQAAPALQARPGQRERWRVINACSSRYLALSLNGAVLERLGRDVGPLAPPGPEGDLVLAPGNRADLVVTTRTEAGTAILRAEPYDRGGMGSMMGGNASSDEGPIDLIVMEVSGAPQSALASLPRTTTPRDLRERRVSRSRVLTLEMGMGSAMMGAGGGMGFTIDGRPFDAKRVDQDVTAGAIEDWTIRNNSSMAHPFHLHVWPMQVLTRDAQTLAEPVWRDVVDVPARSEVTVRIAFDDYTGRTVYHCHILDHEDRGMMGVIDVS